MAHPGSHGEYTDTPLEIADLNPDPLRQVEAWVREAEAANLSQPLAMTVATATSDSRPSARVVLLRGVDECGLVFFTNYESRKSEELSRNPYAAAVFYWPELGRQLRVEGRVERVSAEESDAYFRRRPRGSRLGAWASPQSRVIADRRTLDQRMEELEKKFANGDVPRPPYWGGFRIIPDTFELWHGRLNRLHDRFRYRKDDERGWIIERLAP
jgi:pyridoxamine 5'-phosphate oxidase